MFSHRSDKLDLEASWFYLYQFLNIEILNLGVLFGQPGKKIDKRSNIRHVRSIIDIKNVFMELIVGL